MDGGEISDSVLVSHAALSPHRALTGAAKVSEKVTSATRLAEDAGRAASHGIPVEGQPFRGAQQRLNQTVETTVEATSQVEIVRGRGLDRPGLFKKMLTLLYLRGRSLAESLDADRAGQSSSGASTSSGSHVQVYRPAGMVRGGYSGVFVVRAPVSRSPYICHLRQVARAHLDNISPLLVLFVPDSTQE